MQSQPQLIFMLAQEDAAPLAPVAPAGPATPGGDGTTTVDPGALPLGPAGGGAGGDPQGQPGFGSSLLPMLMIVMVVMIVFSMTGQRKEKKKREQMLSSLKKGAKVQTVGGILGSVVEVRDNDLVLKIDENSNTRVRFARTAVQSVLDEQDA